MVHLIYKYLVLNNQVTIPGIGIFSLCREPAGFNSSNGTLNAPSASITFNAGATDPRSAFFAFISSELKIGEAEATRTFDDFVKAVKENLSSNKEVHLPGLGLLFRNQTNELLFQPAEQIPGFFPDISVDKKMSPVTQIPSVAKPTPVLPGHKTTNRESQDKPDALSSPAKSPWGKYVLILAIIAVIAVASLVYYFIRNAD